MGKRGEQFQSEVLAVVRQSDVPLSAYDILDKLRVSNAKLAPTTVYRALSALIERGHLHRLESLNAFIACQSEGCGDNSVLSICDDCGSVEESAAPDVVAELSSVLGKSGFAPARHVIEVHGVCADCGAGHSNT